jgi:hypothetical protein
MKTPLFSVVRRASTEIQSATDSEKGAKEHHVEGYDDDGYTYHKYPKQGPIRMVGAMLSIIASYYVLFVRLIIYNNWNAITRSFLLRRTMIHLDGYSIQ